VARFKPHDSITNGRITAQVYRINKDSYQLTNGEYYPINIVDRLWQYTPEEPADGIYGAEIVEE